MKSGEPLLIPLQAAPPEAKSIAVSNPAAVRLPWLDGLRGVAALAVALHHIRAIALPYHEANGALLGQGAVQLLMTASKWGMLGVPCFFVLSGFCVGQTWERARSPGQFAQRRWRRIFPAYYASLALVLVCVVVVRLVTGVNDITPLPAPTISNLVATLTLMTAPATSTPIITWVYWTLTYEVVFYFLLTALLLVPSRRRSGLLCLLHTAICVVGVWPGLVLAPGPLFFAGLWPVFGLGLALALASRSRIAAWWIGITSLGALGLMRFSGRSPGVVETALLVAGFIALCLREFPLPRWRPIERLGEFSYSLYLVHVPILLAVGKYFLLRPHLTPAWLLLGVLATVALMVIFAYGFYRLFERPFTSSPRFPVKPTAT